MEDAIIILEVVFWDDKGYQRIWQCTHYEVRLDEVGLFCLSMFIRNKEALFLEGQHFSRIARIETRAINLDKYTEIEVPDNATMN